MRIRGLEQQIRQNIQNFKDKKNSLDTLNNEIISLNKDIEKKDRQIKTYNEVIDNKNDELLQAQKVMEAMSVLNYGLKGDIEKLKDKLQGAIDKGIEVGLTAKEHEKHLLNDIALYFNWVKDLDKNLKELEAEKQKKEGLRDQELAQLRKENAELATNLQEVQNQITTLTAERDSRPNITLAQWNDYHQRPTRQELTQINNQLTSVRQELDKEKGWWDKWINALTEKKSQYLTCSYSHAFFTFKNDWIRLLISANSIVDNPKVVIVREEYSSESNISSTDLVSRTKDIFLMIKEYYKNTTDEQEEYHNEQEEDWKRNYKRQSD